MARFQPEEMLRTLERHEVRYVLIGGLGSTLHGSPLPTREGLLVPVAALEDIIHSKETANREKDRQALPTLRRLLQKTRRNPLPGA